MKTERNELTAKIRKRLDNLAFDSSRVAELISNLENKYAVPNGIANDIIFRTPDLNILDEYMLFFISDCLNYFNKGDFFTEIEIKEYSRMKYEEPEKIKFPIRIKCLQVTDNQWLGTVDSDFLIGLYKKQLIVYNTNTQRVLKRRMKGKEVVFSININKTAVNQIAELVSEGAFIPNTLTLNMSEASEADYYYDAASCELVIKSIKAFDILDGYHRLLGLLKANDKSPVDYPVELRIAEFSEDKAKQFIYQEDQKTKMSKIDSDSMNTDSDPNFIATRLNESTGFNFKGEITNTGNINYAEFSAIIKRVYYTSVKYEDSKKYRLSIANDLKKKLNLASDEYTDLLTRKFDWKDLMLLVVLAKNTSEDEMGAKTVELFSKGLASAKRQMKIISSSKSLRIAEEAVERLK